MCNIRNLCERLYSFYEHGPLGASAQIHVPGPYVGFDPVFKHGEVCEDVICQSIQPFDTPFRMEPIRLPATQISNPVIDGLEHTAMKPNRYIAEWGSVAISPTILLTRDSHGLNGSLKPYQTQPYRI